jgi:integrase
MASVTWRRGAWELRYRDRHGRQRTERFRAPQSRRPPEQVLDRQAEVERDVLPYWGQWQLCDIRPSDIDDWVARLGEQMGPWSVRHCYQLLRGPLRRAVKDRIVADPCIDIALPKRPDLRKTFDDVLTAQEVDALVAGIVADDGRYAGLKTNGRYRALVFMGAWLGPRWNEALGLRVCDLTRCASS